MHPGRSSRPLPLSWAKPARPLGFSFLLFFPFESASPLNSFQPFFKAPRGAACLRGGGMSGGVAGAMLDLMLLGWWLLMGMHPCMRMLLAPPVRIRLSVEVTVT